MVHVSSVYAPANHTFAGWGCKFQGQSVFSLSLGETVNFKVTVFFSLSQAKAVNFKVTVFFFTFAAWGCKNISRSQIGGLNPNICFKVTVFYVDSYTILSFSARGPKYVSRSHFFLFDLEIQIVKHISMQKKIYQRVKN